MSRQCKRYRSVSGEAVLVAIATIFDVSMLNLKTACGICDNLDMCGRFGARPAEFPQPGSVRSPPNKVGCCTVVVLILLVILLGQLLPSHHKFWLWLTVIEHCSSFIFFW